MKTGIMNFAIFAIGVVLSTSAFANPTHFVCTPKTDSQIDPVDLYISQNKKELDLTLSSQNGNETLYNASLTNEDWAERAKSGYMTIVLRSGQTSEVEGVLFKAALLKLSVNADATRPKESILSVDGNVYPMTCKID